MEKDTSILFAALKDKYTIPEAVEEINRRLVPFGPTCKIKFRKTDAEITDSYLVTAVDVRHIICEIIRRTGITKRSFENLSAEWEVHNAAWKMNVGKSHAKDVSLDYDDDPRFAVRAATAVFDALDFE